MPGARLRPMLAWRSTVPAAIAPESGAGTRLSISTVAVFVTVLVTVTVWPTACSLLGLVGSPAGEKVVLMLKQPVP